MTLQKLKQILAIAGIVFVLFEIYYHYYEKPRVAQLINDAKLLTLLMLTENFEDESLDPEDSEYIYTEELT